MNERGLPVRSCVLCVEKMYEDARVILMAIGADNSEYCSEARVGSQDQYAKSKIGQTVGLDSSTPLLFFVLVAPAPLGTACGFSPSVFGLIVSFAR